MIRLFETASGLARLGLMVGVAALAVGPARAGGLLGRHHAQPVVGVAAASAYVVPAVPVYTLGTVSGHARTAVANTTSTALTTASPPPFVGAVAPVYYGYGYSTAPAAYAPAASYSWSVVPSLYGYSYGLQAAQPVAPQPPAAPRSYLSQADVPVLGAFSPLAPAAAPAASPAGQRILQGLAQFARAHASQIASVLGPLLIQEANRLFVSEFGVSPNASDYAVLTQLVQAVLGQSQTASGTGGTGTGGGNMIANLGNGQPIQVQSLTIQAGTVQLNTPNVVPTPNPNPAPNPNPNPPNSNPSDVSAPPSP